jgi:hypothetical protein
MAHKSRWNCQPISLGGSVKITDQGTALHPSPLGLGVHYHLVHPPQVDHQASVN